MKKNLLIFHPIIPPYRINFFNALSERFCTTICLFWRNLKDQIFDYPKLQAQFHFQEQYLIREEIGLFNWIKGIWKMINASKPTTVISTEFGIPTVAIIAHRLLTFSKYKIVVMNDDSYDMTIKSDNFTYRHMIAKIILLPFIDDLIVVDSRVAKYYQRKYKKGIWFPIIYDDNYLRKKYHSLLPQSNKHIIKYGLKGKKILLFVGRLVAIKNVVLALKCFLKLNYPDSVFVIIGDGPEKPHLEQISHDSSNVIFTGRLEGDALYLWYNIAHLFILPSLIEPFGAVVSEALIAGCKVIVSQRAGSSCLIFDEENGEIFDPENEDELQSIMKENLQKISVIEHPLSGIRTSCLREDFVTSIARLHTHL